MRRVCCKVLLAAGLLAGAVLAAAGGEPGGEGMTAREIDASLWASLGDVIDRGADLYNDGDIAGCYRLFEGGLTVAQPLLKHRPELQKTIEEGLADAKENAVMWKRAWALHRLLERVRREIKPGGGDRKGKGGEDKRPEKKPKDKGAGDKEPEKKRPEKPPEKEPEEKTPDVKGGMVVSGKVTYKKKPLAGGTIVFVPAKKGTPVTATIQADGTYEVKEVPVGECRVAVRPDESAAKKVKALARYADAKTSGLTYEVKKEGDNYLDVDLGD